MGRGDGKGENRGSQVLLGPGLTLGKSTGIEERKRGIRPKRSSSRSPTRHFRRRCQGPQAGDGEGRPHRDQARPYLPAPPSGSDSHSDSESSCSVNECHPVGRRNPPPTGRGGRGAHMDRGRGRAQRVKR